MHRTSAVNPSTEVVELRFDTHSRPGFAVRAQTRDESVKQALQLSYFSFLHRTWSGVSELALVSVDIHDRPIGRRFGAAGGILREPPGSYYQPYSSDHEDDDAYAVIRDPLSGCPEESAAANVKGEALLEKESWRFADVSGGMLSQRVVPIPEAAFAPEAIGRGALFNAELPPAEVSATYGISDEMNAWHVFPAPALRVGRETVGKTPSGARATAADLHRVVNWSYWSTVLGMERNGAWVDAAAVMDEVSGAAVVITGPSGSGKTTLALHLMARNPNLVLLSPDQVLLLPNQQPSQSGSQSSASKATSRFRRATASEASGQVHDTRGSSLAVVGCPSPVFAKPGTLLGTLLPNPKLDPLVDAATAQSVANNSDEVLWKMQQKTEVSVEECFGPNRRSVQASPVAAIISLNWNTSVFGAKAMARELEMPPAAVAAVRELSLQQQHGGGPDGADAEAVEKAADAIGVATGCHLHAPEPPMAGLVDLLPLQPLSLYRALGAAPTTLEVGGGVRFDSAAGLVESILLEERNKAGGKRP